MASLIWDKLDVGIERGKRETACKSYKNIIKRNKVITEKLILRSLDYLLVLRLNCTGSHL